MTLLYNTIYLFSSLKDWKESERDRERERERERERLGESSICFRDSHSVGFRVSGVGSTVAGTLCTITAQAQLLPTEFLSGIRKYLESE